MIPKKILISILILLLFQMTDFSQDQKTSTNLIVRVQSGVDLDFIHENITGYIYLRYKEYKDTDKPRVIIRLCSTEPIQLAVVKSALSLPSVLETFTVLGYPTEKVVILKSKDCISKYMEITTAEVWTVFPNAELPPYDEKYLLNQIDILKIGDWAGMEYLGSQDYIKNAYKLISKLSEDESAKGIILGVYRKNPNAIRRKFRSISKLLEKKQVNKTQYIFQKFQWKNYLSSDTLKKKHLYPAFFIVKVTKSKTAHP